MNNYEMRSFVCFSVSPRPSVVPYLPLESGLKVPFGLYVEEILLVGGELILVRSCVFGVF